jgi:hypothetical protein
MSQNMSQNISQVFGKSLNFIISQQRITNGTKFNQQPCATTSNLIIHLVAWKMGVKSLHFDILVFAKSRESH